MKRRFSRKDRQGRKVEDGEKLKEQKNST